MLDKPLAGLVEMQCLHFSRQGIPSPPQQLRGFLSMPISPGHRNLDECLLEFRQCRIKQGYITVVKLSFSPAGKHLATAGGDKVVRVWDVETGKELGALSSPDRVGVVAFSPDGKSLAAGSKNGSVRIWVVPAAK